ncbi:MAG: hypothetical protein DHS20C02_05650 [Micavibrio sp.]|nr:MAG: hypothetical protein DHS20C02_05650 [Micavibrio sp.]
MSDALKLGIIGLSEGNGHPYSWSTIFNGYNPKKMERSGFPNIASYLSKQNFPDDQISGADVTHIWTQDRDLSQNIAESCHIENISENYTDFIGQVDAVLLARDDHETHFEISKPFLEAGVSIFIDKPLAVSVEEADKILGLETYEGQIFTCTALRYAQELYPSPQELEDMGPITQIICSTVKSWDKYAIHLIEPVIHFLGADVNILSTEKSQSKNTVSLVVNWDNDVVTEFQAMGPDVKKGPIRITYCGEENSVTKDFSDAFSAFKAALMQFVGSVRSPGIVIPRTETLKTIRLIEEGLK